ncbi:glutamate--cysteine ligase [Zooshikella marina]|uniref:glutamate--cysteine ligase n=1 Tax=Zooshikella ganghwensis TaxID=202772 RepID=UPI001BB0C2B0|nr:glutamate--cysteine ligase [Zooshikella ganghwensis]MBU2706530.1 glutamate--cysteine ligase [Zooshikella ganghwensis]
MANLADRLKLLSQPVNRQLLKATRRGIEKESLRVSPNGFLAQTPHPLALGSKLTHPYITTDYSEALLEFITPAFTDIDTTLGFQHDLHRFTQQHLADELLWVNSMPCILTGDENIPIAYYGESNIGKMKYIYREGLAHRYGKAMQTIAGIHYNFSLAPEVWSLLSDYEQTSLHEKNQHDLQSSSYLNLIRNFRRLSWLLMYLFGASPAVCRSFFSHTNHQLQDFDDYTVYLPYATSLRMSDLGYQNNAQSGLNICYNTLPTYIESLEHAIRTPFPDYEKIGLTKDGHYLQLNTNILQIENEYYNAIRPKRTIESGERPARALQARGIEYIEVRCLDLNPFDAIGINASQAAFMDVFLTYCALAESPTITTPECEAITHNFTHVVLEGRKPGLQLQKQGNPILLTHWAKEIIDSLMPVAALLDDAHGANHHQESLQQELQKVENPELTPSGQLLHTLSEKQYSFSEFTLIQSKQHAETFKQTPIAADTQQMLEVLVKQSLQQQAEIEAAPQEAFETFLANYYT